MGRTEPTIGLAPQAYRKDVRAKQARVIINKTIPALLASNARARRGVESASLIVDPPALGCKDQQAAEKGATKKRDNAKAKSKGKANELQEDAAPPPPAPPPPPPRLPPLPPPWREPISIRVRVSDTLTAAHLLYSAAQDALEAKKYSHYSRHTIENARARAPKTLILNMASPLRPGGGVLNGATSQEEFLCARSTLHPSLHEAFYRLPEVGGVLTRDVFVFRGAGPLDEPELRAQDRWWVDVVSAAALQFPDVEEGEDGALRFAGAADREAMERKMRAVMRIACAQGARNIVLGAWGCGAYGNPVAEVARGWKKVILGLEEGEGRRNRGKKGGGSSQREDWEGVEEIVFAISNKKMARDFARYFGDGVGIYDMLSEQLNGGSEEVQENTKVIEELNSKIKETEAQIIQVWNPDLKARLETVLSGLRRELTNREGITGEEST
ncbi:hypothetical protein AOQ84DRAFT_247909, partial [Glonium stellatum]